MGPGKAVTPAFTWVDITGSTMWTCDFSLLQICGQTSARGSVSVVADVSLSSDGKHLDRPKSPSKSGLKTNS